MHTIMVIGIGLALLIGFLLIAKMLGVSNRKAAGTFVPIWFIGAGINVWIGMTQAGYTMLQELPVFLVTFAIPAVAAWGIARRAT